MVVQCERCREIVALGSFELERDGIRIACPACGERYFVAAAGTEPPAAPQPAPEPDSQPAPEPDSQPAPEPDSQAAAAEPDSQPAAAEPDSQPAPEPDSQPWPQGETGMRCPKCGLAQPRAPACRACGLRRDRFGAYAADPDQNAFPELDALWHGVEASWDEPAAHDRFVEAASAAGAFAHAARHYRDAARDRPGDAEAARRLARIARMAEAALLASAAPPPPVSVYEPYKKRAALLFLLLLLLAGVMAGVYAIVHSAAAPPAGRAAQPAARERPPRPPLPRRIRPAPAVREAAPAAARAP